MPKKSPPKKEEKPAKSGLPFGRKKLGYRTPKRFRRQVFRRKPVLSQRTRGLGGHR